MNELSWMLYAADVAGSLGKIFGAIGFGGLFFGVVASVAYAVTEDEIHHYTKTILPWFMVPLVIAALIPSPQTIYAIAASEMGEEVLQSPTASKAMKALDKWLDDQLDEGKP